MELKGIDVSKYQGNINWQQVKNAGYSFAFIRVGWCGYEGRIDEGFDPYYDTNMKNAIAAGINVGVYVYSYAKTEAAAKICANAVLEKIKPYKITMPIVFDYEDSKTYANLGKNTNTAICKAFLNQIQAAGYYAMLYTYTSFANSYLNMNELAAFDFWVADYRGYVGYKGSYGIWQYSSTGTVPGISGNVDMNIAYKDYPSIIAGQNEIDLTNAYYRVNMVNKCQAFSEKNVNKVLKVNNSDYLPIGDYKILEKDNSVSSDGFYWCKIQVNNIVAYAVYNLPDGRSSIVTLTKDIPVSGKSLKIIIANKNQAFSERNTNKVVKFGNSSYIPVGIYTLVSLDTAPQEEGFYWCKFIYTDNKQYYAVYNLPDKRCEIIDTPKEPDPEPTPEPTPEPESEVTKEEFNKALARIDSLEKSFSSLNETVTTITEKLDNIIKKIDSIEHDEEDINSLNTQVEAILNWIKSFE